MGVTRSAQRRWEVIDECLRNTTKDWTKHDLIKAIDRRLDITISESQLRDDIKGMRHEYNAPIALERDGRQHFYRYTEPDFSIKTLVIPEEDIQKLRDAMNLLRQIRSMRLSNSVDDVISKLESRYKVDKDPLQQIVYFEDSPIAEGTDHFEDIYDMIVGRKAIKLVYKKFGADAAKSYVIHPYAIKQHNGRLYVWCYSEESKAYTTFALDRIQSMTISPKEYKENTLMTVEEYFHNVIGVTVYKDSKPEDIGLWFSPYMEPYILSKRLHHSQTAERASDGLYVSIRVVVNPELISLILSYGEEVKVIRPASLIEKMREKVKKMGGYYRP